MDSNPIFDLLIPFFADPLVMALMGLFTHFLFDMIRIKKEEGKFLTLAQYWKEHPHQSVICVISMIVGLVILYSTGRLSPEGAYGVGYVANSLADKIGKRTGAKFD